MKNNTEWPSALLMILIGVGTAAHSYFDYTVGSLLRMGPGYFPLILGVLLTLIGVVLLVRPAGGATVAEKVEHSTHRILFRPWLAIVSSMVLFIVVGRYGGLVPATFLLVFVAALGDSENSLKTSVLLAAGVTIAAVAVFSYGMRLQFPLFTWG